MCKPLYYLIRILNLSLILHVSSDANFDTIEAKIENDSIKSLRFSLFYLPIGLKIYYFFTLSFDDKCKCIASKKHILDYNLCEGRKSKEIIDKSVDKYISDTLKNINEKERVRQEEFLKIRISENKSGMSVIHNKTSYYTTIMLALASFYIYLTVELLKTPIDNMLAYFSCYTLATLIIFMVNLSIFLKNCIQVNSFHSSSFKTLREDHTRYALTKAFYRDWYASNDDVRYFTGLVRNCEKYLYLSIIFGVITFAVLSLNNQKTSPKTYSEVHLELALSQV